MHGRSVTLLRSAVVISPSRLWRDGEPLPLVPTLANDAPAFEVHLPHGFGWLMVVEHSFRAVDPARYR